MTPPGPRAGRSLHLGGSRGRHAAGALRALEERGRTGVTDRLAVELDLPGLVGGSGQEALESAVRGVAWLSAPGVLAVREVRGHEGGLLALLDGAPGVMLSGLLGDEPLAPRVAAGLGAELADVLVGLHGAAPPGSIRPAGLCAVALGAGTVLVAPDGSVRLVAFGLERAATLSGAEAGASPERRGGEELPPGDVYALGVLLLECLAGANPGPFPAGPAAEHDAAVERALGMVEGLPPAFGALLREMLAHDADARPSPRAVARALRALAAAVPGPWMSAWAADHVAAGPPLRVAPAEAVAAAPPAPAADAEARPRPAEPAVESLRPLQKRGGTTAGEIVRGSALVGGVLAAVALSSVFAAPVVTRWWLDNHGPMDMASVPTELDGPPDVVSAGGGGSGGAGPAAPPPVVGVPDPNASIAPDLTADITPDLTAPPPAAPFVPGTFALAQAKDHPVVVPIPAVEPDVLPPEPPPPPPDPAATFGTEPEPVNPALPPVGLVVDAPLADQTTVVCAGGLRLSGVERAQGAAVPQGRCDVERLGPEGKAWGSFRLGPGAARVTCRVVFAGQLRCSTETPSAG